MFFIYVALVLSSIGTAAARPVVHDVPLQSEESSTSARRPKDSRATMPSISDTAHEDAFTVFGVAASTHDAVTDFEASTVTPSPLTASPRRRRKLPTSEDDVPHDDTNAARAVHDADRAMNETVLEVVHLTTTARPVVNITFPYQSINGIISTFVDKVREWNTCTYECLTKFTYCKFWMSVLAIVKIVTVSYGIYKGFHMLCNCCRSAQSNVS